MSALTKVRKLFPHVKKVVDAKRSVLVNVSLRDNSAGRKKDFANCALAKACVRQKIADGAIIGLSTSYLIKGDVATRYKTSEGVSREVVSFDRSQKFAAGKNYCLSKIPKTMRFKDGRKGRKGGKIKHNRNLMPHPKKHRTANVRKLQSI